MESGERAAQSTFVDFGALLCIVLALGALWATQPFAELFGDVGQALPATTQVVLDLWVAPFGMLLLGTSAGVVVFLKNPGHGRKIVRWNALLAVPILIATIIAMILPILSMASET